MDVKEREAAQKQAELDKQKSDLAAAEKKLADEKAKAEADRAALETAKAAISPPPSSTAAGAKPGPAAPGPVAPASTAVPSSTAAPAASGSAAGSAPTAELSTKEAAVKAEEAQVAAGTAAVAAKKAEVAAGRGGCRVQAGRGRGRAQGHHRRPENGDRRRGRRQGRGRRRPASSWSAWATTRTISGKSSSSIPAREPRSASSRINTLHLGSLVELADSFVAVSGLEGKQGGVKLVKLDKASLESVAEGKPDMFPTAARPRVGRFDLRDREGRRRHLLRGQVRRGRSRGAGSLHGRRRALRAASRCLGERRGAVALRLLLPPQARYSRESQRAEVIRFTTETRSSTESTEE